MLKYLVLFLIPAILSFLITPLIQSIAKKLKILDLPSKRKIHKKPTPRLGGIPIFIGFNLTILLGILFDFGGLKNFYRPLWKSIILAELIILGIGIYDDVSRLKPGIKFFFQIVAGSLLVLFGFKILIVTNPFNGNAIHLGILSIPITIIWLVGITNALNLVDGLDGLAAGTAFIACLTILGVSYFNENTGVAVTSLVLAGSILGFLRYNFHPAKIFLGDSGSLLLGFLLAFLSIKGSLKGATLTAVLAPLLALGLPIMDTLLSMMRRVLKSVYSLNHLEENDKSKPIFSSGSSIFKADKNHIHHRLLKFGFSQRKAVVILYGICLILCSLALISAVWSNINITLVLTIIIIASFIGIKSLRYGEFKIFENGLFLPLFDIPLINKKLFQAFLDLFFIFLSYYFSSHLIFSRSLLQPKAFFIQTIAPVIALKLIIFYLSGLYKGIWRLSNIEGVLKIGRASIFSSIGLYLLFILFFDFRYTGGLVFFVLDFFITLFLVAGSRISYRVADYYYHKNDIKEDTHVVFESGGTIIYGAGRRGAFLASEFQSNNMNDNFLVGFIDDDLNKKGKTHNDLPILGNIENLKELIYENKISEIILSSKKITKEKINSLKILCIENEIDLKLFDLELNKIV